MGSSVVSGRPEQIIDLPGPTYIPLVAALSAGLFFVGFLAELYALSGLGAVLLLVAVVAWLWDSPDRANPERLSAGHGLELPLNHGLHQSPAWSGLLMTLVFNAALYSSLVFAYIYLWSFAPAWPPDGVSPPEPGRALVGLAILLASSGALFWAEAGIRRGNRRRLGLGLLGGAALGVAFLAIQAFEVIAFGLAPDSHAYAALTYALIGYHGIHLGIALVMVGLALARLWRGDFTPERHLGVRIATWFWHYTVAVWLIGFALVYFSPYGF